VCAYMSPCIAIAEDDVRDPGTRAEVPNHGAHVVSPALGQPPKSCSELGWMTLIDESGPA
jgi:hypothetical protein